MSQGISILVFPQTMLHQHLVWESCVWNCAYGNNVWYCETPAGHHLRTNPKHVHICPFLLPIHFFCSFSSLQLHVFKKLVKGYYSASLPFTISCSYYLLSLETFAFINIVCKDQLMPNMKYKTNCCVSGHLLCVCSQKHIYLHFHYLFRPTG